MSSEEIIERIKKQLDISDRYAYNERSHPNIMTAWEIQNDHIRDMILELDNMLKQN